MLILGAVRIMRVISSIGFAVEIDEQIYMANPLTKAITNPALEGGIKVWWVLQMSKPKGFFAKGLFF